MLHPVTVQALRDEFVNIKLAAKLPPQARKSLEAMATRLAKGEKKAPKEFVMRSLGRGGPIGGAGKAVVEGLPRG